MNKKYKHQFDLPAKRGNVPEQKINQETGMLEEATHPMDYDKVKIKAEKIYQEKGGDALDNWLEAERLVKQEQQGDFGF